MRRRFRYPAVLAVLIIALSISACGDKSEETGNDSDKAWADRYVALIQSGEARDYEDYDNMKKELDRVKEESGATYAYILSPMANGKPALDGDPSKDFAITVDAGDEPDDWGVTYEWELQFKEAWDGDPATARSAWDDSEELQCWSAFAPVYDSEDNVVCILGIDYPCTDVIADYPEWNRDHPEWNGYETEITGEIPAAVQTQINEVKTLADKYAKELSAKQICLQHRKRNGTPNS